uniref:HAUS augmin like complex subunit 2 n=1 Tax=Gallus gallus TaxID=9031 RepID=A0A8V0ZBU6_CHICK
RSSRRHSPHRATGRSTARPQKRRGEPRRSHVPIPTKSGGRRGSRRNRLRPRFPPPFETRSAGSPHGSSGSGTCQPAVTPAVAAARRPPFRVAQDGGAPPLGFLSNGALQPRAPPKGTAGLRRAEAASAAERRPGRLRPLGVGRAHGDRGRAGEETLDLACEEFECFARFSEREKMANIRAEINEKKLETELLQLEMETADIVHPFYLSKKYQILQDVNRHLEAVLKEKKRLRQRLIKPICQETLPIKADFHKYVVELLTEAVTFIEKLENHLQTVRVIPQVPTFMKNLDVALTKTEVLVTDLEELTEQIVQWREVQKEVYSDSICNTAELDLGLSA